MGIEPDPASTFFIDKGKATGSLLRIARYATPSAVGWLLVTVLTATWALLVAHMSIAAYESFHAVGNDLGLYNQVFWSTTHGHPFYSSRIPNTDNLLGHHFVPLAIGVILPFYYLWPDAQVLLIAQSVALSIGAFPLFAFAGRRLPIQMAVLVVMAYLLSPFLASIALADFHEIALAVPLLMAAGAALVERQSRATLLMMGLALLIKEEMAIILLGFGLYALIVQRRWRIGVVMLVGALAYAWVIMGVLMPGLNPAAAQYPFLGRYDSLGDTPIEIAQTLFTQPVAIVDILAAKPKLEFLASLLWPSAGLPLLGFPTVFLAVPTLAYLLLSDYSLHFSVSSYYSAPLLPFLFLAIVTALGRLRKWNPRLGQVGAGALLVAAVLGARMMSPLPFGVSYDPDRYEVRPEHEVTQDVLKAIPSRATVRADWRFFPHLPHARISDSLNVSASGKAPDYVVLGARSVNAILPPAFPWLASELPDLAPGPLSLPRYEFETLPDGTRVGIRQPDRDVSLQRIDASFERGLILVGAGTPTEPSGWGTEVSVTAGSAFPVWLAWAASSPVDRRVTFTAQLFRGNDRVAQVDQEMGKGLYPTTLWQEWREEPVVVDEFSLAIPPDLPGGRYRLKAGAYQSDSVRPLVRPDGSLWVDLVEVVVKSEN